VLREVRAYASENGYLCEGRQVFRRRAEWFGPTSRQVAAPTRGSRRGAWNARYHAWLPKPQRRRPSKAATAGGPTVGNLTGRRLSGAAMSVSACCLALVLPKAVTALWSCWLASQASGRRPYQICQPDRGPWWTPARRPLLRADFIQSSLSAIRRSPRELRTDMRRRHPARFDRVRGRRNRPNRPRDSRSAPRTVIRARRPPRGSLALAEDCARLCACSSACSAVGASTRRSARRRPRHA
jgi:hypothetical protein